MTKKIDIGEAFVRLFRGWFLILLVWFGAGVYRYYQRASWLKLQTVHPAVASVTAVERRLGKRARQFDYVYQYPVSGRPLVFRADAYEPPAVGDTFDVEYVEAEPDLHRRKGEEFGADIMGTSWILGLALGSAAHVMGYFFWLMTKI